MRWFRCCREWCLLEYSWVEAAGCSLWATAPRLLLSFAMGKLSNPQFIMVTKWLSESLWCNQYDQIRSYMLLASIINGRGQRSLEANAAIDIWWYLMIFLWLGSIQFTKNIRIISIIQFTIDFWWYLMIFDDFWSYLHHNGFILASCPCFQPPSGYTTAWKSSWSQPAGFHLGWSYQDSVQLL